MEEGGVPAESVAPRRVCGRGGADRLSERDANPPGIGGDDVEVGGEGGNRADIEIVARNAAERVDDRVEGSGVDLVVQGDEQRLAAGEHVVEAARRHIGGRAELLDGGALKAGGAEHVEPGGHQSLAPLGIAPLGTLPTVDAAGAGGAGQRPTAITTG